MTRSPSYVDIQHSTARLAGLGGQSTVLRVIETIIIESDHPDPVSQIDRVVSQSSDCSGSGWLILLGYELNRAIEPKASFRHQSHPNSLEMCQHSSDHFPFAVLQRVVRDDDSPSDDVDVGSEFCIGELASNSGSDVYIREVKRTLEYIKQGDIYQANISHQLSGDFEGDPIACFDQLVSYSQPRMGAMMSFVYHGEYHAVLSVSPEVFLSGSFHTGAILSEPMKGTRPIESDPSELIESQKDQAELNMITDLMRNDLGRVCKAGSIRVVDDRKVEAHQSGVLQASSVIEGQMRDSVDFGDVLRATFPPGSITGAPKVRAMQIIEELEGRTRGPYCGSMLYIDDTGEFQASVLIRTAHIQGSVDPSVLNDTDGREATVTRVRLQGGRLTYAVGAGIVADSDPVEEWNETITKAGVLTNALGVEIRDSKQSAGT